MEVTCSVCGGSGYLKDEDDGVRRCVRCFGYGVIPDVNEPDRDRLWRVVARAVEDSVPTRELPEPQRDQVVEDVVQVLLADVRARRRRLVRPRG